MLQFEWRGLRRVISGGQTGADQAGLYAAKSFGLETGGTAPRGYRTEVGPCEELRRFGLVESTSAAYKPRTICNVADSDGTVILSANMASAGTVLTLQTAMVKKKPVIRISLHDLNDEWIDKNGDLVSKFIRSNRIEVLNVAGNRAGEGGRIFSDTFQILEVAFHHLKRDNLLVLSDQADTVVE